MMYDKDFLLQLDKSKNKTIFARITALTFDELPVETIEGRVTQGSVNIDGSSAVRRTCSLSLAAQDFQYNDFYWGLNTKFKLEVGVENKINPAYPNIIWFKQGIFLITSFSTSHSANSFSISIQGKDKMSLLNGEVGGTLESSIDFGCIEEESADGVWTIKKIPIPEIIRNAVHVYGGEPLHNIIINDLNTYGLELLEYRYDTPMYLYRETKIKDPETGAMVENMQYTNATLDGKKSCRVPEILGTTTLDQLGANELESLVSPLTGNDSVSPITIEGNDYYIAKIELGQTAGYRETDLVYAGDLIANVGESLTSVLDKIKNMLAEFEYFYDVDGRFIFQKKQSFISTMWSLADGGPSAAQQQALAHSETHAYIFSGSELITSFNNNPNLLNLRNDYSVWGERTSVSGAKIPVHLRYAIDRKPTQYTSIAVDDKDPEIENYNKKYNAKKKGQTSVKYSIDDTDWREIIYQMANDYYKYNMLSDFEMRVRAANPEYVTGRTGYENYYIDLQGFWRQLYNPEIGEKLEKASREQLKLEATQETQKNKIKNIEGYLIKINSALQENPSNMSEADKWFNEFYEKFQDLYKKTFEDVNDIYVKVYYMRIILQNERDELENIKAELEKINEKVENYTSEKENYYYDGEHIYWNKDIYEAPDKLNFWFDFLDSSDNGREMSKYDVKNIGARPKAINDSNVKSIYFRETPNVIYVKQGDEFGDLSGYRYINCGNIDNMFTISAQGKSAKEKLDELLYQHSYCIESATITTIPIYYLEPNTRIYIHDEKSGLNGDYIVSKISLPLSYNGTMQITATKAAENIIK